MFKNIYNKIKIKMSDIDRDKILAYCEGKAFDFFPRFLCYVALLLLIGKREIELLECCWKEPITPKCGQEITNPDGSKSIVPCGDAYQLF